MKTLIACDSFKGSLTSKEVGQTILSALKKQKIPTDYLIISDGGEGFLDALKFGCPQLEEHSISTFDSLFRKRKAKYLLDKDTLYFCLADVVGIGLLKEHEKNVYTNSTYGLGVLIKKAIEKHSPKKIILSIGGSSTNDLGLGMLEGMGATFYNGNHTIEKITLKDFDNITHIDLDNVKLLTKDIEWMTLTDVTNPLLGKTGATYIYGEQKGISPSHFEEIDQVIQRTKDKLVQLTKFDPCNQAGSGAAGGVGYMTQAVFHSSIKSGIQELLDLIRFEDKVKEYDMVITGEGCLDEQSFNGKVISGIMSYPIKNLIIISAIKKIDYENAYAIVPSITTKENSMKHPKKYLRKLIQSIFSTQ